MATHLDTKVHADRYSGVLTSEQKTKAFSDLHKQAHGYTSFHVLENFSHPKDGSPYGFVLTAPMHAPVNATMIKPSMYRTVAVYRINNDSEDIASMIDKGHFKRAFESVPKKQIGKEIDEKCVDVAWLNDGKEYMKTSDKQRWMPVLGDSHDSFVGLFKHKLKDDDAHYLVISALPNDASRLVTDLIQNDIKSPETRRYTFADLATDKRLKWLEDQSVRNNMRLAAQIAFDNGLDLEFAGRDVYGFKEPGVGYNYLMKPTHIQIENPITTNGKTVSIHYGSTPAKANGSYIHRLGLFDDIEVHKIGPDLRTSIPLTCCVDHKLWDSGNKGRLTARKVAKKINSRYLWDKNQHKLHPQLHSVLSSETTPETIKKVTSAMLKANEAHIRPELKLKAVCVKFA